MLDFSTTIAGPHCTPDAGRHGRRGHQDRSPPKARRCEPVRRCANSCQHRFRPAQCRQEEPRARSEIARCDRSRSAGWSPSADILVENFRPGVMRRLKLDYGSLQQLNPKLIYCSISGYGQTGPSAELPAYAPVIHAASGYDMAHLSYQPGRTPSRLLRHLSRRRPHRRLCLRRDLGGAVPASRQPNEASTSTSRCWNRCSA